MLRHCDPPSRCDPHLTMHVQHFAADAAVATHACGVLCSLSCATGSAAFGMDRLTGCRRPLAARSPDRNAKQCGGVGRGHGRHVGSHCARHLAGGATACPQSRPRCLSVRWVARCCPTPSGRSATCRAPRVSGGATAA